jgi:quercetin dioxygenase-like cupin family protein
MAIKIFHRDQPAQMLPIVSKDARLVVWPGIGSEVANMNYVVLEPGEENQPHSHAESEDTIFILEGRGSVADLDNDVVLEFEAGDAIHVPPGVRHAVRADRDSGIVSVGGPCPADQGLLKAIGAI